MWIKTQKNNQIVNSENFDRIGCGKFDGQIAIIALSLKNNAPTGITKNKVELGIYGTMDEAAEVLDSLCEHLQDTCFIMPQRKEQCRNK